MGIRDFFRNRVNRMAEGMDVFKKDVFELEGVPAFREYYTLFIFVWQAIYKGFYRAWHEVPLKTIKDPKGKKRTLATMNAGKMACSQMARYVWNERCSLTASMKSNPQDDPLNGFLQYVLKDNRARLCDNYALFEYGNVWIFVNFILSKVFLYSPQARF